MTRRCQPQAADQTRTCDRLSSGPCAGALIVVPTVAVPQPDGSVLIKGGRPVVVAAQEIGTRQAARILGLSQRRIEAMIEEGKFIEGKEWTQPGGRGGRYRLRLEAVLARRLDPR